ncbi:RNA polymerase sigma factor [Propionibacterium australiense]|uniref:Sigma-70 family RNA polymerase sigma factor n=1 Tax=Propionibacterium australiense TaxID=119981 RepID=A0A8B3FK59_9ACTN|nr:sigma-70 family RNA polymerase sigma factor [Propionibacterium australiense]RLP07707.1 sigma-70 family RNA polymerase sigma factor [Propionibacterium australiense]RLP08136.1 sigma-70 family RNA polymerase sigma factor [Propionibacterium australiense]
MDSDPVELLRRVGDGDECALAELYARFAASVHGFVSRRVPDRGVVEEVCADVWLGCWRSARSFRGDSRVLTWLLGIASRQVYVHTRRKRRPTVPLDSVDGTPADAHPGPADVAVSRAGSEALVNAMEHLPEDLYEVIVLAWLHDLPYGEISDVVGIPVGTVKSRVSRARRLLREEIGGPHE